MILIVKCGFGDKRYFWYEVCFMIKFYIFVVEKWFWNPKNDFQIKLKSGFNSGICELGTLMGLGGNFGLINCSKPIKTK